MPRIFANFSEEKLRQEIRMNTKSVDYLNIGLILLSLWLAIMIPFGLFIYAYAILGPLHYLTEINWLRDKKYYVADRWWIWLVLGLCALLVIPKFLIEPAFIEDLGTLQPAVEWLVHWSNAIIFLLLATALILLNVKKRNLRLLLMGVAIVAAYAFNSAPIYITLIGLLVPTLIHVYLFTLLFMIYGAIKSKSIPGRIAALLVALVPIAITLRGCLGFGVSRSNAGFLRSGKEIFREIPSYFEEN